MDSPTDHEELLATTKSAPGTTVATDLTSQLESATKSKSDSIRVDINQGSSDIVLSSYNAVRDEIVCRTPLHYQLIMFKYVIIGGMLSFLAPLVFKIGNTSSPSSSSNEAAEQFLIYSLWAIPLVSMMFDEFILRNFILVSESRHYIQSVIFPFLGRDKDLKGFVCWEEYVKDNCRHPRLSVPVTVWFVWITSLGTACMVSVLRFRDGFHPVEIAILLGLVVGNFRTLLEIVRIKYWQKR